MTISKKNNLNFDIIPTWQFQDNHLNKNIKFISFADAISFIVRVSMIIEKLDHHPQWSNTYNSVSIKLTTHSEGQVTQKDIELALEIDKILLAMNLL